MKRISTPRQRQAAMARKAKRFLRTQKGKKPRSPIVTKAQFAKALQGTAGVRSQIAKNLGISYNTVKNLLMRPDWADMRDAWLEEIEARTDEAEWAVLFCIRNNVDLPTKLKAATWLLEKVKKELYGQKTTVSVEGGATMHVTHLHVPVETLDLPLDIRRKVLEAAEAAESRKRLLEQA